MATISSEPRATHLTDYNSYIMDSNTQVKDMRKGGRCNQSIILTYTDGSEWVFLNNRPEDKPEERFCGFLYLQNALKEAGLNKIKAAPNKMAIHDREIIYLSQYCGEKKPEFFEQINELSTLKKDVGFTDITGSSNLRKMDDEIYVFDTEKSSFDRSVHEKIDSFINLHGVIRSALEEKLKI